MDLPGPGNYEDPLKFGKNAPMVSIMGKREIKKDNMPGPGTYNASDSIYKSKSPSFRMGTGKRSEIISREANHTPGPGIYD